MKKSKIQNNEDLLYKTIGARIQKQREILGLTQEQLAKRADMNRTSITNIERGIQRTPLHVLYLLAEILSTNVLELLPKSLKEETIKVVGKDFNLVDDYFNKQ